MIPVVDVPYKCPSWLLRAAIVCLHPSGRRRKEAVTRPTGDSSASKKYARNTRLPASGADARGGDLGYGSRASPAAAGGATKAFFTTLPISLRGKAFR